MDLQIETALEEWKEWRNRDPYIANFYLSFVRNQARKVVKNYGHAWTRKAEELLVKCCERYDIFCGIQFIAVFSDAYEHEFCVTMEDTADTHTAAQAWHGTGERTYQRTQTSVEERIACERSGAIVAAIRRKGSRKDED